MTMINVCYKSNLDVELVLCMKLANSLQNKMNVDLLNFGIISID